MNSVLAAAIYISLKLNQNCNPTKAGNTMECRRLDDDHTDIAATVLAVYKVVSCQLSRLKVVRVIRVPHSQ